MTQEPKLFLKHLNLALTAFTTIFTLRHNKIWTWNNFEGNLN